MEKRGRFIKYDKQAVLQDIVDGRMSATDIAKKHKITRDMVYTLKFMAKKKNILQETATKVCDLDPVEVKQSKRRHAHEIYLLAQSFSEGEMSGVNFYNKVCQILGEPI